MNKNEKIKLVRESFKNLDTNYSERAALVLTELYNDSQVIIENLIKVKTINPNILSSIEELGHDIITMNSKDRDINEKNSIYRKIKEDLKDDLVDLLIKLPS